MSWKFGIDIFYTFEDMAKKPNLDQIFWISLRQSGKKVVGILQSFQVHSCVENTKNCSKRWIKLKAMKNSSLLTIPFLTPVSMLDVKRILVYGSTLSGGRGKRAKSMTFTDNCAKTFFPDCLSADQNIASVFGFFAITLKLLEIWSSNFQEMLDF